MTKLLRFFLSFFVLLCVSASLRLETQAQVRPIYDRGTTGLVQALKRVNAHHNVLMIGAHPDDEDTSLLAYLARGDSARTAYLSLTRGDGGQNIIGPELGETLGVIRTEELLQARRLDGAEQFFGRVYDYGFSKTLAEAKSKWNEQIVLCDTVRVIRSFRPAVVIAQFSGTPADGHGQHQFAGYIVPLAVTAAADPAQCADSGKVWAVSRIFVRHRGTDQPSIRINTGRYDPVLGRSYFEIAMEARSQHKSQEQGVLELRGEQFSTLRQLGAAGGGWTGVSGGIPLLIDDIRYNLGRPLGEFSVYKPEANLYNLKNAYLFVTGLIASDRAPDKWIYEEKRGQITEAMTRTTGLEIDAFADTETVVPGESFFVGVKAYLPPAFERDAKIKSIELIGPERWKFTKTETPKANTAAFLSREVAATSEFFKVTVDDGHVPTQPYWLTSPRDGDLFRWPAEQDAHTLPFQRPLFYALVTVEINGVEFKIERPVEYRFADDIRGEIRRNVDVVPHLTLKVDQPMLIVPQSDKPQVRQISVSVTNHASRPVTGTAGVSSSANPEWRHILNLGAIDLKKKGEKASFTAEITIPAKTRPGSYTILPNVKIGETVVADSMNIVEYPHIQTHRFYRRAAVDVRVIDLKTAPTKVGYLAGSGDRVPDAIKQMGFNLEMISESELANGQLSRFDVIVVGIRAYQVRPDLVANNKRLLDFANAGGTLIVQYQLPAYASQNLAPFPHGMAPRTSDENAEVKIVMPDHTIFNFPNKIGADDFAGWVQERNLYNFSTMDPKYIGLLETHDANEAENKGGLVIADVGKGKYIYCSYSLFRQLPAGVPGAYRLLANMLSMPKTKK